ncbi:MAG: GIY-YIG nuclease family protein [Bacteroidetes bacterium]|nr:GIY-YIG nuclease family protein [Bacteroidota bacterium]
MKTRKEIKAEYKLMKFPIGIFQIRNKVNGKIFVGSTTDLKAIWFAQKLQLDVGIHQNAELQQDWKQFGADQFVYEILEEIKQDDEKQIDYNKELKILEEMVISELKPFNEKGYHKQK